MLLNLASVLLTSVGVLLNKFALGHLSPLQAAFLNAGFAAAFCVVPFTYLAARSGGMPRIASFRPLIIVAGLANAVALLLLFILLDIAGPITVGFLGRLYIVFAVLIGVVWFRERHTALEYFLILLSLIGGGLFTLPDESLGGTGFAIALSYCLLFAVSNALSKQALRPGAAPGSAGRSSVTAVYSILIANNLLAAALLAGALVATRGAGGFGFDPSGAAFVAGSSLVGSVIGIYLFYQGLRFISFSRANLVRSVQPLFVAAASFPFFPVHLGPTMAAGALLMIVSVVWLAALSARKESDVAPRNPPGK